MIALCLSAGAITATLNVQAFTLAWMHSVEKIRWEEDWRIQNNTLVLQEARVVGTGAGMEPPLDATFKDGSWHYNPHLKPLERISIMHSPYTKEYELCFQGTCTTLSKLLPGIAQTTSVNIEPCHR